MGRKPVAPLTYGKQFSIRIPSKGVIADKLLEVLKDEKDDEADRSQKVIDALLLKQSRYDKKGPGDIVLFDIPKRGVKKKVLDWINVNNVIGKLDERLMELIEREVENEALRSIESLDNARSDLSKSTERDEIEESHGAAAMETAAAALVTTNEDTKVERAPGNTTKERKDSESDESDSGDPANKSWFDFTTS